MRSMLHPHSLIFLLLFWTMCFLLHYRGYDGSAGKPTHAALVVDVMALFDKIHAEHINIASC